MSRRAINSSDWLSYERSFLMTLGILFLALPCWVWRKEGDRSSEWSLFAWALFYGFAAFGAVLLLVALLASKKSVDKWAETCSTHEASIAVMIIAAPVYFLLRWFTRKK